MNNQLENKVEARNLCNAARIAADVFCSVATQFNARFDRARFLAACGF